MQIIPPKDLKDSVIATKAQFIKKLGAIILVVNTMGLGGVLLVVPEKFHKQATTGMTLLGMAGMFFGVSGSDRILKERVAKGDIYTEIANDGNPNKDQARAQIFLESKLEEDAVNAAKSLMDRGVHPGNLESQIDDLKMQLQEERKLVAQYGDAFKGLAQTKAMVDNSQTALPAVPFVSEGAAVKTTPDRVIDANWQAPV
jgi:hypothetical protein